MSSYAEACSMNELSPSTAGSVMSDVSNDHAPWKTMTPSMINLMQTGTRDGKGRSRKDRNLPRRNLLSRRTGSALRINTIIATLASDSSAILDLPLEQLHSPHPTVHSCASDKKRSDALPAPAPKLDSGADEAGILIIQAPDEQETPRISVSGSILQNPQSVSTVPNRTSGDDPSLRGGNARQISYAHPQHIPRPQKAQVVYIKSPYPSAHDLSETPTIASAHKQSISRAAGTPMLVDVKSPRLRRVAHHSPSLAHPAQEIPEPSHHDAIRAHFAGRVSPLHIGRRSNSPTEPFPGWHTPPFDPLSEHPGAWRVPTPLPSPSCDTSKSQDPYFGCLGHAGEEYEDWELDSAGGSSTVRLDGGEEWDGDDEEEGNDYDDDDEEEDGGQEENDDEEDKMYEPAYPPTPHPNAAVYATHMRSRAEMALETLLARATALPDSTGDTTCALLQQGEEREPRDKPAARVRWQDDEDWAHRDGYFAPWDARCEVCFAALLPRETMDPGRRCEVWVREVGREVVVEGRGDWEVEGRRKRFGLRGVLDRLRSWVRRFRGLL